MSAVPTRRNAASSSVGSSLIIRGMMPSEGRLEGLQRVIREAVHRVYGDDETAASSVHTSCLPDVTDDDDDEEEEEWFDELSSWPLPLPPLPPSASPPDIAMNFKPCVVLRPTQPRVPPPPNLLPMRPSQLPPRPSQRLPRPSAIEQDAVVESTVPVPQRLRPPPLPVAVAETAAESEAPQKIMQPKRRLKSPDKAPPWKRQV